MVAFADVHGAYDELVALLRSQGLVDGSLRWSGADTRLVSLGDLVDRGPDSRRVLDLLMRLEGEARAAGGAVHVLLGNHEVMNIVGDLRYVSAGEYAAFAGPEDEALREAAWRQRLAREAGADRAAFEARHPAGFFAHQQAFSPEGRYGAWLLSRPFVLVVNDTAFTHGGLPARVAELGLDETNRVLHRELDDYLRGLAGNGRGTAGPGCGRVPAASRGARRRRAHGTIRGTAHVDGRLRLHDRGTDVVPRPGALQPVHRGRQPRCRAGEAGRRPCGRRPQRDADAARDEPVRRTRDPARHRNARERLPGQGLRARHRGRQAACRLRRRARQARRARAPGARRRPASGRTRRRRAGGLARARRHRRGGGAALPASPSRSG